MIFVTIGTMYGFQRLVQEMDDIACNIGEEVLIQIGETEYEPKNTKYFRFKPREEMKKIYKNSRIVICHAGIGSIVSAMEYMKPIIVVPRRKEYGEVIDDHQLDIARELENEGIIKVVYDIHDLNKILKIPINFSSVNRENILVGKLKEYINQLSST